MRNIILKYLLTVFILGLTFNGLSQTCTIVPSSYKVCLGSSVSFALNTSGSVTKITWSFGDGATDTLLNVAHIYATPGSYTATVIVKFSNNTNCTASVSQIIKVFDVPKANFTKSRDTLCLTSQLCLLNTSTLGSSGAPIRKVTFLFGDGAIVYNQNNPCHTYTKTGNYIATLEIEDTNGCISRIEKNVVVVDFKTSIQVVISSCGVLKFNNTSAYPLSKVKRFYWDFGDGTFDSAIINYNVITHVFTNVDLCPFSVKLYIESVYGCSDFKVVFVCPLYKFNVKITHDYKKMCLRGNEFTFSNPVNPGAIMSWAYKPEGTVNYTGTQFNSTAKYTFPDCGQYIIALTIRTSVCDTIGYDTIEVLGPHAIIERDTFPPNKVINRFQCTPDTAYFVSPTLYQSRHCSSSIKRLWDFGDTKCPQCTTDTKNGINVNSNCRWSKDSLNVKHKYSDTGCFDVHLMLWDTITGCADMDSIKVVIGRPDLSKIKITGKACLGATQFVDLSQMPPLCGIEEFRFNKDTMQGSTNPYWVRLQRINFSYIINSNVQGDSSVTGFAFKNGNCYDTLFYVKHFPRLHPRFMLTGTRGCAPFTTTANILDSFQKACSKAIWNWGDGSSLTLDFPIVNGFVKQQSHTYAKNGLYAIKLSLYDTLQNGGGCVFDTTYYVGVGFHLDFNDNNGTCYDKFIDFGDKVRSWANPYDPLNPYRSWLGRVQWYYGDGYVDTISSHTYNKAGTYKVKLVATDTNGCKDSLEKIIIVNEFKVNFTWTPKILVCGQIVQFNDSSRVIDSSGVLPRDSIISWLWDFGDQRAQSTLRNPAHAYFVNGDFFVKLKVKTLRGCSDSVIIKISIAGPMPGFQLLTDSVGCAPYTIMLRNTSNGCDKNIIYMGDPANSSFIIGPSDTITFTYAKPGIYYIYIFGEASFVNPNTGSNVYCSSWYPDKTNPKAKLVRIVVLAKPPVKFLAPDTICVNTQFNIINVSNKVYDFYKWEYGDSTSDLNLRPDTNTTHTYKKTGTYSITLKPNYTPALNQKECPDTFAKKIIVVDLTPGFTMSNALDPLIKFTNTSVGAQSYLWDFGHPKSGIKNFSREISPEHDYLNDTGVFIICLTAFNIYGCVDSVCHEYRNTNYRLLLIPNVFSINNDGLNDAFDINIHGEIFYDLKIFNRWGTIVYNEQRDGEGNDGVNWNGKVLNKGNECEDGVYYIRFQYQFRGEDVKTYKGVVTLIR